jgi:hypothetical protein
MVFKYFLFNLGKNNFYLLFHLGPRYFCFSHIRPITFSLLSPPSAMSHRRQASWPAHPGAAESARPCGPASTMEIPYWPTKSRSPPPEASTRQHFPTASAAGDTASLTGDSEAAAPPVLPPGHALPSCSCPGRYPPVSHHPCVDAPLRPHIAQTNPPITISASHQSCMTDPHALFLTGAPPPPPALAAGSMPPPASRLGPPLPHARPQTGAICSPLASPTFAPRRSPEFGRPSQFPYTKDTFTLISIFPERNL